MAGPAAVRLLVLADLILDSDVLLPIIRQAAAAGIEATLLATRRFADQGGDRARRLAAASPAVMVLGHRQILYLARPRLAGFDAVLTAAESSAPAHRTAHALTRRANARGLCTFTVQHGLENVGLTYLDNEHGAETTVAAERIFLWGTADTLHPAFADRIAPRALGVGCPKPVDALSSTARHGRGRQVLVCENLHWRRYDDGFRRQVVDDLLAVARERPEMRFLVKPHPAGRWLDDHLPAITGNVECIAGRHALATAPLGMLLDQVDLVLTTPSTIALDAARAGRTVAVLGYGLDLPAYAPLPIIRTRADWNAVLRQAPAEGDPDAAGRLRRFVARACLPGNAAERILADIVATVARRRGNT